MVLSIDCDPIAKAIREVGFVRFAGPSTAAGFLEFAGTLGDVIDDTLVRLTRGAATYLSRPGPIPLHTDHPDADLLAWQCEEQDPYDGASLLVDGRDVARNLPPATVELLGHAYLPAAHRPGHAPRATPIVAHGWQIFDAPWLDPIQRSSEILAAVERWRRTVSAREPQSIRLLAGEVLVVDNHRMLHGRAALTERSPRRLRRLWIRRRNAVVIPHAARAAHVERR